VKTQRQRVPVQGIPDERHIDAKARLKPILLMKGRNFVLSDVNEHRNL
jgi:hypothetical protein